MILDQIGLSVSDLARSEPLYDQVLMVTLGFRKGKFQLVGDPHIQHYNRHFGVVLRPARGLGQHDAYTPGLHHLCWRVDSAAGIAATPAQLYPQCRVALIPPTRLTDAP